MANRGYKLQEFVAHSANVNCLSIGKKACRLLITGGDDHKVNLWSIGKSDSLMSLCGHASPVESVAFDSAEVLVVAGASTGMIKLWDLEETKMVRSFTGHRSYCTAVEFHPFGEFFASGSMDTNLKIWDIRKKGCIHTYKGHTRGISNIRFTPDGRWVVSGGLDNSIKVWDLTAGKLLHDFKFHEGHIRSIAFHPLEFLLATGSADRTVKFWDLETFEMIGSARPEATGVRSITFHPDGRTLFCGLDDCLKVYSWEPVLCHDAVDLGWSTLGDLCIHDGKLLGCSYYENSVGVWAADISCIEPYGAGLVPEKNDSQDSNFNLHGSHPSEKEGGGLRSTSVLRCTSPDYETKEIKNIYVDSENPVSSQKDKPMNTPEAVPPLVSKEVSKKPTQKQGMHPKANGQVLSKSFIVPSFVPRESPERKDSANSRRESIIAGRTNSGMLSKPTHIRRPSNNKIDGEKLSAAVDSGLSTRTVAGLEGAVESNFRTRLKMENESKESCVEKHSNLIVAEKIQKNLSPCTPSNQEKRNEPLSASNEKPVKIVNGVAVVSGRTRSLVERFEKRERVISNEEPTTNTPPHVVPAANTPPRMAPATNTSPKTEMATNTPPQMAPATNSPPQMVPASNMPPQMVPATNRPPQLMPEIDNIHTTMREEPQVSERESTSGNCQNFTEDLLQTHDAFLSTLQYRMTKLQVVRHFWERNDIKGAINALKKLPDYSVQADVISVLMEKMDILTLDLFSCLLPVLVGLLDSVIERHASISLEMLLKLVAVFGPVIQSTISAPRVVGVDLHAEQRLDCCNQCHIQLQKIQKILPTLIRRGGLVARCAQELNLVIRVS